MTFKLPKDIKSKRTTLPDGTIAYEFKHKKLGKLGRLTVQNLGGQTHISAEVAGSQNDPRNARRQALLEPIVKEISEEMNLRFGSSGGHIPPPQAPNPPGEWVAQKKLLCSQCDESVALLVFAEGDPRDEGLLEDYCRKMYDKIAETNLPTWIIGPPIGLVSSPQAPSDIMKVWPERGPAKRLSPNEFNDELDILQNTHCTPETATPYTRKKTEEFSKYHNSEDDEKHLEDLMKESKNIHDRIHTEDQAPENEGEEIAAEVWQKTHEAVFSLIMDGAEISMMEMSLFYQFCQLNSLIRGLDGDAITGEASRMEALMKDLAQDLREVEASLVDDGPTEDMEALGAKLEVLKQAFHDNRKPPPAPEDLYQAADKINRALFGLVGGFLDKEVNPFLIQSAMMYYWLRTSTINAGVNEMFFQKLERHWPFVVERTEKFLDEWVQASG